MDIKLFVSKFIKKEKITEEDMYSLLYEVCEDTHASCNFQCPVYELNDGKAPTGKLSDEWDCVCFKNGKSMFEFIKEKLSEKELSSI